MHINKYILFIFILIFNFHVKVVTQVFFCERLEVIENIVFIEHLPWLLLYILDQGKNRKFSDIQQNICQNRIRKNCLSEQYQKPALYKFFKSIQSNTFYLRLRTSI